jgi:hypothetical protein
MTVTHIPGRQSDNFFLTVPTAGKHPELLQDIVSNSGLDPQRVILVRTSAEAILPAHCVVLDDFGSPNIQRWWNLGISEAAKRGGRAVAVLNDDCRIGPSTLSALFNGLVASGAAISSPTRTGQKAGLHRKLSFPYRPVIQGALWMLDLESTIRPAEVFVWWFGDTDLDIRARQGQGGIVACDVEFEHLYPGQATGKSSALLTQSQKDEQAFELRWSRVLRWHRWYLLPLRWHRWYLLPLRGKIKVLAKKILSVKAS